MKPIGLLVLLALAFTWPAMPTGQELDPGYWERSPLPQMGLATYYAPKLMDAVLQYRVQHGQLPSCPECVGSVALLRAGDIGRKVWLQPREGGAGRAVPGGRLRAP